MDGKKVISKSVTSRGIKNGNTPFNIWFTGNLAMLLIKNKDNPRGGVTSPTIRFNMVTTPKCTGSTPAWTSGGAIMGTTSNVAVVLSRNIPTMINSTVIIINRCTGFCVNESMLLANTWGICSTARIQPKREAAAMIIKILTDVRMVW